MSFLEDYSRVLLGNSEGGRGLLAHRDEQLQRQRNEQLLAEQQKLYANTLLEISKARDANELNTAVARGVSNGLDIGTIKGFIDKTLESQQAMDPKTGRPVFVDAYTATKGRMAPADAVDAMARTDIARQNLGLAREELALSREKFDYDKNNPTIDPMKQMAIDERKQRQIDSDVQRLSARVVSSEYPKLLSSLQNIDSVIARNSGDIPGYGYGIGYLPDALVSADGEEIRQNVQDVKNSIIKTMAGANVTGDEMRRINKQLGEGGHKGDRRLMQGLDTVKKKAADTLKTIEAGYSPEVLEEYRRRGGIVSSDFFSEAGTSPRREDEASKRYDALWGK